MWGPTRQRLQSAGRCSATTRHMNTSAEGATQRVGGLNQSRTLVETVTSAADSDVSETTTAHKQMINSNHYSNILNRGDADYVRIDCAEVLYRLPGVQPLDNESNQTTMHNQIALTAIYDLMLLRLHHGR
ncbi:uncharacterized protein LOC126456238 [Schistocerca serialis cubense]|uniref:uncharacterized protein LOC126456238 n=1 Tax=Schistocerca serialis cubense TaxID=2023355 RepID=UPI00214EE45A|nr:uncharacterized protein LOC126456238 [Schistocerca serialis cubense]